MAAAGALVVTAVWRVVQANRLTRLRILERRAMAGDDGALEEFRKLAEIYLDTARAHRLEQVDA